MRYATSLLMVLLAVGLIGAGRQTEPRATLFPKPPAPKPPDALIFSHYKHVVENEFECGECHESVLEAARIEDSNTPDMDVCSNCHDEVEEECGMCHQNADDPSVEVASWVKEIRFDHTAHLGRESVECKTCHPGAWTSEQSSDRLTPGMSTCEQCHQPEMSRLGCGRCHENVMDLGRPSSQVAVHESAFFPIHGAWATGSGTLCAQCHEQSFCAECHERTGPTRVSAVLPDRVDRNTIHRGDWIGRHALENRAAPGKCLSCHGSSFCTECHEKELGRRDGQPADYRRSPHPPAWLQRGRGEQFHGDVARIRIQECAACHDRGAASICVDCHKAGGVGGNPHAAGWDPPGDNARKTRDPGCVPCHPGG